MRATTPAAAAIRHFVALVDGYRTRAVSGLDLSSLENREWARLRLASALARDFTEATLLAACRARGVSHVRTGQAAAFCLAGLAIPEPKGGSRTDGRPRSPRPLPGRRGAGA